MPLLATTKFFSLQVEPTGMLAPKVQATTIEVRLRRGPDRSQWWTTTKEIRRLRTFALCFGNRSRNRSRSCPFPQFLNPLGMLHSNVARFSDAQARRTKRTARTSSTVSITTMGAEESINTFRVLSASVNGLTSCKLLP